MVSYYSPLSSSMFPQSAPHPPGGVASRHHAQTASAAAAAVASHAYFQNYHAHTLAGYGHPHAAHAAYNSQYAANLADLNSNNYNSSSTANTAGGGHVAATASGPPGAGQFSSNSTSDWNHQWSPSFGATPSSCLWGPQSSGGDGGQGGVANSGGGAPQSSSTTNEDNHSPPTPNPQPPTTNNTTAIGSASPGGYGTQSHSSGSPTSTPTPAGYTNGPPPAGDMFRNYSPQPHQTSSSTAGGHALLEAGSPGEMNSLPTAHHGLGSPIGNSLASPTSRPQPARSPYEWMKKPSYQSQPEKSGELIFTNCILFV